MFALTAVAYDDDDTLLIRLSRERLALTRLAHVAGVRHGLSCGKQGFQYSISLSEQNKKGEFDDRQRGRLFFFGNELVTLKTSPTAVPMKR